MRIPRLRRYGPAARFYDVLSGERPVYRAGRVVGIDRLGLRSGDRVLDVGCGTGLNFPLLRQAVGATGVVVGVDLSVAMLARAEARIRRHAWTNVGVRHADAALLHDAVRDEELFDAALFTYSLSIMNGWEDAWEQALGSLRPGGRIAVVDLALPTGWGRLLSPMARLACFTGGVDPHRAPWRRVAGDTDDVFETMLRSGHVHVAAGTKPLDPRSPQGLER